MAEISVTRTSDFTQGFHAGCYEAARMLREAANEHTQVAETSRKVLDKQANELAAAILLSWANGIEMNANRVALSPHPHTEG